MHGTTLDIRANIFGDDFDLLPLKFILNKGSSWSEISEIIKVYIVWAI